MAVKKAAQNKPPEKASTKAKASTKGSQSSSLFSKGAFIVGLISIPCGLFYARQRAQGHSSVVVQFEDAGAVYGRQAYGTEVTFTDAGFAELVKKSTLYAGHNGQRINSWQDIMKLASNTSNDKLVLWQGPLQDLPSMRHFEFPGVKIGSRTTIQDPPSFDEKLPIELETLSINPRIFYVSNFMSSSEADALVDRATSKSNPYSIRKSTVGHKSWTQTDDDTSSSIRTSENGFDIDSPTARKLKRRAWKLLRLSGQYDETMVDGFQVLRYQQKQAYREHDDWFPIETPEHNWDPSNGGTNRFATVLVYLSDVEKGGQTVFPYVDAKSTPIPDEAKELFKKNSWENDMVKKCYSKLAVQPKKGDGILFYSQNAGVLNIKALHGGCPVLNGTKWAANLWFWNQCRYTLCQQHHKKAGVRMDEKHFVSR